MRRLSLIRTVMAVACLLLLCGLAPAAARAAAGSDRVYIVKKGDRLDAIARRFEVPKAALIQANKITNPDRLLAGSKLKIPAKSAKSPALAMRPDLKAALDKIPVVPRQWQYIVIHHSGSAKDTPAQMDRYHRQERRMENGLAYHFVIGNGQGMKDGHIHVGHRWSEQLSGGHVASEAMNQKAIGICLVGNFDRDRPTELQMKSLSVLVQYLMQRCDLKPQAVKTHQAINSRPTVCPGKHFSFRSLLATIQ